MSADKKEHITPAGRTYRTSSGEELEVEVYVKVHFKIKTWDGEVKEHEADLPGHVTIRDLKEELQYELGDPECSDWVIEKNNMPMVDDSVIYDTYPLQHGDRIRVLVHKPSNNL